MRRLLSFILLVIYLAGSMGMVVRQHYCMGEKAGFSLFGALSSHCSSCGMLKGKESKDCCKDVVHFFKLKQSHQGASLAIASPQPLAGLLPSAVVLSAERYISYRSLDAFLPNGPPFDEQRIYLKLRHFRI